MKKSNLRGARSAVGIHSCTFGGAITKTYANVSITSSTAGSFLCSTTCLVGRGGFEPPTFAVFWKYCQSDVLTMLDDRPSMAVLAEYLIYVCRIIFL